MKKALRKLIPALVMLLIAAAFVGTSTYAWFSMNRTVTVNGMSVDTAVSDQLTIAAENAEANYGTSLTQTRSAHLRPVSSVNGVNFFYAPSDDVRGNGAAATDVTYVAYSEATNQAPDSASGKSFYDAAFNTAYGVGSPTDSTVLYGYVDYSFYIKATNVTGSSEDLKLTTLNLLYNGGAVSEKAWRVAVFAQTANANTAVTTAPTTSDRKALLALNGATNFTSGKAVAAASGENKLGDVSYTSAGCVVDSIAGGATEYNKVTVRLWLEGEDNTCTNATFATLTSAYTLTLGFAIGGSETAVTVIGSTAA